MELNRIYEYPLILFFAWIMLLVASMLVSLQFLIVEYKCDSHTRRKLLCLMPFIDHFTVGWRFSDGSDHSSTTWDSYDNILDFSTLWTWCENDCTIWDVWNCNRTTRLVFIINWNEANVHDFPVRHSKPKKIVKLCKYHMRTRNTKKGTQSDAQDTFWIEKI